MDTTSPVSFPPMQCRPLRLALENLRLPNLASLSTMGQSCCDWTDIVTCNNLFHIIELKLANKGLSGPIPPVLGELPDLQAVNLSNNRLEGPIPDEIRYLKNLRELSIAGSGLSGQLPPALRELAKLEKLDLRDNKLNGPLQALSNNTKLIELHLMKNSMGGSIDVLPWTKFNGLRILHLSDNSFTGTIPKEIASAVNLEHLELSGNKLSGAIPESLAELKSLSVLWLQGNELSGLIPQLPSVKEKCALSSDSPKESNKFDCISPKALLAPNNCLDSIPRTANLTTCGPVSPTKTETPGSTASDASGGLPMTAIIGIVAGLLMLLAVAVTLAIRRRRSKAKTERNLDSTVDAKPTAGHQVAVFTSANSVDHSSMSPSIGGNPARMSFLVDSHGNRHSIQIPAQAHIIDGSQFIMLQQPNTPVSQQPYQAQSNGVSRDVRLLRQSIVSTHSDPSSLASSSQQPIYIMNPHASNSAANANANANVQSIPIPPIPHFFPNEVVYLGDNPRSSISTTATVTTMATEVGNTDANKDLQESRVGGEQGGRGDGAVAPAAGDWAVKQAVADRPVSMVTVNVPDGYTVSLVPIGRPQTPGNSEAESVSGSGSGRN